MFCGHKTLKTVLKKAGEYCELNTIDKMTNIDVISIMLLLMRTTIASKWVQ